MDNKHTPPTQSYALGKADQERGSLPDVEIITKFITKFNTYVCFFYY